MQRFLFVFLFFSSLFSCAEIQPKVDERVELMSIVFRLAESPEYNQKYAEKYIADINSHFGTYKNHPVVLLAKKLRETHGVSFDAVMSMAVRLEKKGSRYHLIKENQNGLDQRWTNEDAQKFILLLNDFYKKSNFSKFFKSHSQDYTYVENKFAEELKDFDEGWYSKFYGKEAEEDYKIIIGYGNGGGNYGPKINETGAKKTVYAIMGLWKFDDNNQPVIDGKNYISTLIHEFNHSFVNYILDEKYKDNEELKNAGQILIEKQRKIMEDQAYSEWHTLINESIVRAAVINYMKDHNFTDEEIKESNIIQEFRGFLWTPQLTELFDDYSKKRDEYKTFESFYPEIIKFFTKASANIDLLKENYFNNQPKIISVEPFSNNAQNVDIKTKQIIINFSEPLDTKGHSINLGEGGINTMPLSPNKIEYINNGKSLSLGLIDLQPDKEYEFILTGKKIRNKKGYPIDNYTIKFKTSK